MAAKSVYWNNCYDNLLKLVPVMIVRSTRTAAWWHVREEPGSLLRATWEQRRAGELLQASLSSSACAGMDLHGTCSVKESSLKTSSGLRPKPPAFLSVKLWVPQARFNLKAGITFHYCPLFTSGSLRVAGQSSAKYKSGFAEWLQAPVHIAMGLPEPS